MASRPPPSESQSVGAAPDLGATVLAKRVDRAPGQRVVGGEQPPHRLDLVVSGVGQQGEGAGQTLDETVLVEEQCRHPAAGTQEELVIAGELSHFRRRYAQPARGRFAAQPVVDELVDHSGVLAHDESLARRLGWRPPGHDDSGGGPPPGRGYERPRPGGLYTAKRTRMPAGTGSHRPRVVESRQ